MHGAGTFAQFQADRGLKAGGKLHRDKAATGNGRQDNAGGSMPRSRIQRRSWLALIPFARATPTTDAPGSPQASIRERLNSSEWVRRVRRGFVTFM